MATDLMTSRYDVEPLANHWLVKGSTYVNATTNSIWYGSTMQYHGSDYSIQGGRADTAFSGIAEATVETTDADPTRNIITLLQGEFPNLPVAGTPIVGAPVYLENATSTNGTDKWWSNLTTSNTNAYCVGLITGFDNVTGYYTVLISVSLAAAILA